MAGTEVATDPIADKRVKDAQAALTKSQQDLAEVKKRIEAGELLTAQQRDAQILAWAKDDPERVRTWLGPAFANAGKESVREAGSAEPEVDPVMRDFISLGIAALDPRTDEHAQFLSKHGSEGLSQLVASQLVPKLLRTELGQKLGESDTRIKSLEAAVAEAQRKADMATEYSQAGWHEVQKLRDPELAKVDELLRKGNEDPNYFREIVRKLEAAERPLAASSEGAAAPAAPVTPAPPVTAPSPSEQKDAIAQAQGTPAGSVASATGSEGIRNLFDKAFSEITAEAGVAR